MYIAELTETDSKNNWSTYVYFVIVLLNVWSIIVSYMFTNLYGHEAL